MKSHLSVAVIIGALMLLDNHPASSHIALPVAPAKGATFNREINHATRHLRNQSGHELPR